MWETFCNILREQYGTDTPLGASFFAHFGRSRRRAGSNSDEASRFIALALLVAAVAYIALVIGHDWDATFFGIACSLVLAIPLAGCARRNREPEQC